MEMIRKAIGPTALRVFPRTDRGRPDGFSQAVPKQWTPRPAQGANSSPAWALDAWGSALQCSDRAAAATSPAAEIPGALLITC